MEILLNAGRSEAAFSTNLQIFRLQPSKHLWSESAVTRRVYQDSLQFEASWKTRKNAWMGI